MRIVNPIVEQASIQAGVNSGSANHVWITYSHTFKREINDDHLSDYWHQQPGASH